MCLRTAAIAFAAFCQACKLQGPPCHHLQLPSYTRKQHGTERDLLRCILLLAVAVEVIGLAVANTRMGHLCLPESPSECLFASG